MVLLIGARNSYRPVTEDEIENPELIYSAFADYVRDSEQLVKLPETRLGAPGVLYINQRVFI